MTRKARSRITWVLSGLSGVVGALMFAGGMATPLEANYCEHDVCGYTGNGNCFESSVKNNCDEQWWGCSNYSC